MPVNQVGDFELVPKILSCFTQKSFDQKKRGNLLVVIALMNNIITLSVKCLINH